MTRAGALALIAVAACEREAPPAEPAPVDLARLRAELADDAAIAALADASLAAYTRAAAALEAAGDDCGAAADALEAIAAADGATIARAIALHDDPTLAARARPVLEARAAATAALADRFAAATTACAAHPRVAAALRRF